MVFFAFDISNWELSVLSQQIFFISYCFPARSGESGNSISKNVEKFFSHLIWWGYIQMILLKNLTIVTSVLRIIRVKMITYLVILLRPAFYCVQHFTVSSTYCVQQNTASTLTQRFICSNFTCQHAAVVLCCACEAPEFKLLYLVQMLTHLPKQRWPTLNIRSLPRNSGEDNSM